MKKKKHNIRKFSIGRDYLDGNLIEKLEIKVIMSGTKIVKRGLVFNI